MKNRDAVEKNIELMSMSGERSMPEYMLDAHLEGSRKYGVQFMRAPFFYDSDGNILEFAKKGFNNQDMREFYHGSLDVALDGEFIFSFRLDEGADLEANDTILRTIEEFRDMYRKAS